MDDNGKFFLGLLAGLGLGTVLGLLIAPEEGTKTYKKIEKAVKDAANDIIEVGEKTLKQADKEANKATKK